jgi:hypothetical protein
VNAAFASVFKARPAGDALDQLAPSQARSKPTSGTPSRNWG